MIGMSTMGTLPTLGQGAATLGNPQQQESLAQLLQMYKQAQMEMERGQQMGQAQYVNNSGALGVLASVAQAMRGKQIRREANESAASLTERILKAQTAEKEAEFRREQQLKREEQARARAERASQADEAGLKGVQRAEYVNTGKWPKDAAPPSSFREFQLAQENPAYGKHLQEANASRGTNVTVKMPGQNYAKPFDEALAKADVDRFNRVRDDANMAREQLNAVDAIDSILANAPTGKPQEFYARMGQYFGAPAGATFQAQQALVNEQVNAILNAAKGPQTDQDAIRARNAIPSMGTDPRARKVVMDYMRKKLSGKVQESERMEQYLYENKSLQGYKPGSYSFSVDAAPVGGRGVGQLSDDEIKRSLGL
jgi:hypothetical protein